MPPETKYARLGGDRIAYQPLPLGPLPPWESLAEELEAVQDEVGSDIAMDDLGTRPLKGSTAPGGCTSASP